MIRCWHSCGFVIGSAGLGGARGSASPDRPPCRHIKHRRSGQCDAPQPVAELLSDIHRARRLASGLRAFFVIVRSLCCDIVFLRGRVASDARLRLVSQSGLAKSPCRGFATRKPCRCRLVVRRRLFLGVRAPSGNAESLAEREGFEPLVNQNATGSDLTTVNGERFLRALLPLGSGHPGIRSLASKVSQLLDAGP